MFEAAFTVAPRTWLPTHRFWPTLAGQYTGSSGRDGSAYLRLSSAKRMLREAVAGIMYLAAPALCRRVCLCSNVQPAEPPC